MENQIFMGYHGFFPCKISVYWTQTGMEHIVKNLPFNILLTNFSDRSVALLKGTVAGFASRSAISPISLSGGATQELYGAQNIFLMVFQDDEVGPTNVDVAEMAQCMHNKVRTDAGASDSHVIQEDAGSSASKVIGEDVEQSAYEVIN